LLATLLLTSGCATTRDSQREPRAAHSPAEALFAQGQSLAARGDGVRAEQYFALALRLGYPEQRAIGPLVAVCVASSRLRAALDHATPVLRRHPQAWQLRYLVAAIQLALGDQLEAARQLQRVVAQHPEGAQAYYLLAVIARDAARDEVAARDGFRAYLEHAPEGVFAPEAQSWLADHPAVATPATPAPAAGSRDDSRNTEAQP
jgi:tetratricopeptide (TPR) repeat protein